MNDAPKKLRYSHIIKTTVGDVHKLEEEVNNAILTITEHGMNFISLMPHNFGLSPLYMFIIILYETTSDKSWITDEEFETAKKQREQNRSAEKGIRKLRYVHIIKNTVDDVRKERLEDRINSAITVITRNDMNFVSLVPHNFGLSPLYMFILILYETTSDKHWITDEEFGKTELSLVKGTTADKKPR